MNTLVDRLSEYAAALTYDQLPPEVVHQAKRLISNWRRGCGGWRRWKMWGAILRLTAVDADR